MSNSLEPHGLQRARLTCLSLSSGVCSDSCPLSVMLSNLLIFCHLLLLWSSIFPSSRVFSNESGLCITWPKYWSCSFSPAVEYSGPISFKIGLISLMSKGLSRVFSGNTVRKHKHQFSGTQPSLWSNSHIHA